MLQRSTKSKLWVAAIAMVATASVAYAVPLPVGGTLFPAPSDPGPIPGTVVDSVSSPFVTPTFTGTIVTTVISGDLSNPFGGLTFIYQVANDIGSVHPISRATMNGFTGWLTDVSYQVPTTGVAPALINRPTADFVGFTYFDAPLGSGLITPGATSAVMVIRTNAPAYRGNFVSVIDGFVATVPSFSPIPEPATMALLGLAGILAARRRK